MEYTNAESRKVVVRGSEVVEMERDWSKGRKLQLCRMNKSRELFVT